MLERTEATLIAIFRTLSDAKAAAGELTAHAFAGDHIHLASGDNDAELSGKLRPTHDLGHREQNVENWCDALGPETARERHRFEAAVRQGNTLLALDTPEQMLETASGILKQHAPLDIAILNLSANAAANAAQRRDRGMAVQRPDSV